MSSPLTFITTLFDSHFGEPEVVVVSPGRINLIGEHTDYNDGLVFPAAINKYIWAVFSASSDEMVNIIAANYGKKISFSLKDIDSQEFSSWLLYIVGVIKELRKVNKTISGFNLVFGGDIPIGAGLSSSAALENAVVFGLNELFGLGLDKREMIFISQRAEHNFVGVKCGIMDQFTNMFAEESKFLFLDTRNLEYELIPFLPDEYELVLVNSNIKHNLAASEYNRRRKECEQASDIIRRRHNTIRSLRDVDMQLLEEMRDFMPTQVYMRAKFVLEEMQRVVYAKEAILAQDWVKLGSLLRLSHQGLRDLYQVSCKELDFLVGKAMAFDGVLGSRMMGAGFGGCVINLIRKDSVKNFSEYIRKQYFEEYSFLADVYEIEIVDGIHRIS